MLTRQRRCAALYSVVGNNAVSLFNAAPFVYIPPSFRPDDTTWTVKKASSLGIVCKKLNRSYRPDVRLDTKVVGLKQFHWTKTWTNVFIAVSVAKLYFSVTSYAESYAVNLCARKVVLATVRQCIRALFCKDGALTFNKLYIAASF